MASFIRFISRPPVDVYPLLGAVSVACGYGFLLSFKNLTQSQDVIIDKSNQDSWQQANPNSLPYFSVFLSQNRLPVQLPSIRKNEIHY